jgi:endo-1,4-beta-xylanase
MKRILTINLLAALLLIGSLPSISVAQKIDTSLTLKDKYKKLFPIGVAVSQRTLSGNKETELLLKQFSSMTPENAMKMGPIHPLEHRYNWAESDAIVNFAQQHGLLVRGHNLCWHEQTPRWIFTDSLTGQQVTKEVLLQRLKDHITTVVNRYKGKIYAWDVVNEAIDDDSNKFLRNSKWYEICGDDFIIKAFEYAHAADPKALLFYNEYNSERPEKRERIYKLLKMLKDKKVPIHGVGLQAHWSIYEPTNAELTKAIEQYSSLGLQIHFTEVDISIYPWEKNQRQLKPGEKGEYTAELEQKQIEKYNDMFKIMRKYKNVVKSVTFWNVSDRTTWLDNYPVRGRKNFPLLFDQNYSRKKAFYKVVDF